jgi:hypothetical protein
MKMIKKLIIAMSLWIFCHTLYLFIDGLNDEGKKADVAIVLGTKINNDGTLSARLQARLDQSIVLYRQQRVKKIIVSGIGHGPNLQQAKRMHEYLLSQGIPATDIYADDKGYDTERNVKYSLAIMKENNLHSAISVSQYFHQTRAKMLFRKAGFDNISSSSPTYFEWQDIIAVPREFVAFYVEWLWTW